MAFLSRRMVLTEHSEERWAAESGNKDTSEPVFESRHPSGESACSNASVRPRSLTRMSDTSSRVLMSLSFCVGVSYRSLI